MQVEVPEAKGFRHLHHCYYRLKRLGVQLAEDLLAMEYRLHLILQESHMIDIGTYL